MASTPIYKLLIGAIVPRPIAFISTVSPEGKGNLAPFSFFNGVSSDPPCIMVAITRKPDGGKKDTLRNIEATRQFVVNSVSEWMAEPMNYCSADFPYEVDEMEQVGLTPIPSLTVKPPRVKESPIHLECELYNTMEVGDGRPGSSTIVVGRIVTMHIHERAYDNGRIRIEELRPLSRLAGFSYGKTSGIFDIPRPKL
ncbi:MAG: hypothetical protein A2X94_00755 [Bdellovibrionales bacterium GWB1_55_8]|nr:MAG: hypothetical protein A2X94_00755 [Bdellovibrionales bacterium GWB1_55_8]